MKHRLLNDAIVRRCRRRRRLHCSAPRSILVVHRRLQRQSRTCRRESEGRRRVAGALGVMNELVDRTKRATMLSHSDRVQISSSVVLLLLLLFRQVQSW